ncbi:MAG TPA: SufD family Fe-S cluster assembly protein, partial [Acetobacteraceae bacterium]|nr:SufD family Fe-S cluster assembly protein [Acetobacteraceae bacterium]
MTSLSAGTSAESFLARYRGLRSLLPGPAAAREAAADLLARRGLPGPRDEDWKYTSLRPLAELEFHTALTDAGNHPAPVALPDLGSLADAPRVVFVAGRYRADLSVLPQNVTARRFSGHAAVVPREECGRLVALNTLLAEDGANLEVAAGTDAGVLLLIHMGADLYGKPAAFHPRHEIRLGEGAALTLVDISAGHGTYLHNPVLDVALAPRAKLQHFRLQIESPHAFHLGAVRAHIAEGASYDSFSLISGARLTRGEIHARLAGPG